MEEGEGTDCASAGASTEAVGVGVSPQCGFTHFPQDHIDHDARRPAQALARSRKTCLTRFQRRARPTCADDTLAYNVSILSLEHSCLQHTQTTLTAHNPSRHVSIILQHPRASRRREAPTLLRPTHILSCLSEASRPRPELPGAFFRFGLCRCQHRRHTAPSSSGSVSCGGAPRLPFHFDFM
jgi:hypothetical protein